MKRLQETTKTPLFRSSERIARWLIGLLCILLVFIVFSGLTVFIEPVKVFFFKRHVLLAVFVIFTSIMAIPSSIILFLFWVFRTRKNLPILNGINLKFSPAWSILVFFIPILNLFRPYQVIAETWEVSDPATTNSIVDESPNPGAPKLVFAWWAFWLLSEIMPKILPNNHIASVCFYLFTIVALILTIIIVRAISRMQTKKHLKMRLPPRIAFGEG